MIAVPPDLEQPGTPPKVVLGDTAFIVGAARSGTSLLYKVLCLHPQTAFISNWLARTPSMPAMLKSL